MQFEKEIRELMEKVGNMQPMDIVGEISCVKVDTSVVHRTLMWVLSSNR